MNKGDLKQEDNKILWWNGIKFLIKQTFKNKAEAKKFLEEYGKKEIQNTTREDRG